MKLSLEIIRLHLEEKYSIEAAGIPQTELMLDRPKLYFDGCIPQKYDLFLLEPEMLEKAGWDGCSLVCVGRPDRNLPDAGTSMLIIEKEPFGKVFNEIQNVFDLYDNWDLTMNILSKGGGKNISGIFDASIPIFKRDLQLSNTNFQFEYFNRVYFEKAVYEDGSPVGNPDEYGFLPSDIVNYFKFDDVYSKVTNIREPFIYPATILPFRTLCMNLFLGDELIGRITIPEYDRPVHDTELVLLAHMASYVQAAYISQLESRVFSGFELRNVIRNILAESSVIDPELINIMERHHWNTKDNYACILIKPSQNDEAVKTQYYLCREIENLYEGACAVEYKSDIIAVINLFQYGNSYDLLLHDLAYYVREGYYKAGISNTFNNIEDLKYYYKQAAISIEVGLRMNPMKWLFIFNEYSYSTFLKKALKTSP